MKKFSLPGLIIGCLFISLLLSNCKKVVGPAGPAGPAGTAGQPGTNGTNGTDGYTSLINVTPFNSSTFCANGGVILSSGIDKNKNGVLDSSEVDHTQFLCNGANGSTGNQDSIVYLEIPNSSVRSYSAQPVIGGELLKFKKSDYPGVDSIIFVSSPYVADTSNYSVVQLYDITDQQPIAGSSLSSNKIAFTTSGLYGNYVQSGNLYNNLPDKEITLGVSVYSRSNAFAGVAYSYLFLFRH